AVLATVTVLAHGAAFVSLGAALGVWIRRRGQAIAASVGLVLLMTVGWPIVYLLIGGDPNSPPAGLALAGVVPDSSALLFHQDQPAAIAIMSGWVGDWDVILILSAAILSGLAIRTVGRRSRGIPPAVADADEASLQPAGGEAGSAATWKGGKWT